MYSKKDTYSLVFVVRLLYFRGQLFLVIFCGNAAIYFKILINLHLRVQNWRNQKCEAATSTFEGIDIAASLLTALLSPPQKKKLKLNLAVWTNKNKEE